MLFTFSLFRCWRYFAPFLLFLMVSANTALAQPPCDDDPTTATITYSGPVCPGGTVAITIDLDDDDEQFDITYSIGQNTFVLEDIEDDVTVTHVVTTTVAATLISIYDIDDDCINTINESIIIVVFPPPTVSISNIAQPSCGQGNGSITATASGGTAPYEYSLDGVNYQSGNSFNNLSAGVYTVYVEDNSSCEDSVSVTLNASNAPSVNIVATTQPACGQSNGSITATATGGTAPYAFSLNGGSFQGSGTFPNLAAGTYTVTVRDANLCTATAAPIVLNAGNAPTLTISSTSPPSCGQGNGSITATATGGTAPYEFSLDGVNFQNSGTFQSLSAGVYTVTVLDAAGCSASQTGIELNDENSPVLSLEGTQAATCAGADGTLTVVASGGVLPYQFSLNGVDLQANGFFQNLSAGFYNATVTDAAGCSAALAGIEIESASASLTPASVSAASVTACPGTITFVSGNLPPGTTGAWTGPGVVFENQNAPQSAVSAPVPDIYVLTWTLSAPGCPGYSSAQVTLTVPSPPTAANDGLYEVVIGDELVFMASDNDGFSSGATYQLLDLPNFGMASINAASGEITYSANTGEAGLDTFSYVLCEAACNGQLCDTALVIIEVVEENCSLEAEDNVFPEGITPNGDGFNDRLHFVVIDERTCPFNYAQSELIIYNRWGDRVFEASPYNNDWEGGSLPHGTYYYVLRVDLEPKDFVGFGNVTIFRD